jgi:hypothetical protein
MGRAEDKAGRQLGVYMNMSELEQNRQQYKEMREVRQAHSASHQVNTIKPSLYMLYYVLNPPLSTVF